MEMQSKTELLTALAAVKKGERVRVLFDMLMEAIGATQEVSKAGMFELIKKALEDEQEALKAIMPEPGAKKKKMSRPNKDRGVSSSD